MKLIRAAPGAGKTALVFREFKQALRGGVPHPRIVVPTATLVRHFQHELARDGVVFSPGSVISLNRFMRESTTAELVPDGLLRAIVRDALARLKFPEFSAVATTEGMAATVVDTIQLFENTGCTPEKLATVRKLGLHAKPFEKLWRAVRDAVRTCGYQLRGDWIRTSGSATPSARIWFDGFLAFTPIEQEFIRNLAKSTEITLTITDSPATDEIRKFALPLGAEDRLLPGPSRRPGTTLIAARSLEREADEIARRIVALLERGTAFRSIGVALREGSTYVPLLKGTFDRFGIPARFYFANSLRKHPAAEFLGGLISGALNGWDYETSLETFRAHPRWCTLADFDRYEFAVREAMPGHGAEGLLSLCESDGLRAELAECLKVEAWTSTPRKPSAWQRRFQSLAENLYRPGLLEPPADHTGVEAARGYVAGAKSWVHAIASIAAFWPAEEAISLTEFWRVASVAVETGVVQAIDDRADVVHVMNVYEARQWDIDTLFVCGMTDRDFPRQHIPNLLFPDTDMDRLRAAGIPLRKAYQEREERWLVDALKTRATESLFLTYPEHDASGKSVQRSRLLDSETNAEPSALCRVLPQVGAANQSRPGRIDSVELQAEMARLHQTISLTALEDLAQCRFKFFGGRTLALKTAPERPEDRLTARITGSILHVALERWLADKNRDFVELFEEAFGEACRKEHLPPGYKLEVERIRSREIAERVSANDLWVPDSSEAEVALAMDFPGGISVKCRIDRIDRFGNDCVIVDYKSSKTANVEKLVASTTRLQGPLYALAVREKLHLNPVAMLYWAVREDERYGWGEIPGTDLEFQPMPANWASDARTRTVERLSGFLAGQVYAHPEETEPCRWCDFAAACRVEQTGPVEITHAAGASNG